jgi:hypothetical protein
MKSKVKCKSKAFLVMHNNLYFLFYAQIITLNKKL